MEKITLTIGHNVQGVPTLDTARVCSACEDLLGLDGYTALPCYGMWKGAREDSTRIEVAADAAAIDAIRASVPALAHALEQDSIMCEAGGRVEFLDARKPALCKIA